MTFKKILVPTDFSAASDHALEVAVALAQQHGAELVVAHCWYMPPTAYSPITAERTQTLLDEVRERLDQLVRSTSGSVSGVLLSGVPWLEVVQLIEARGIDLCVVGTHGRTGVKRVLLGSFAEKVVRHAPCSVLAIHPDDVLRPFRRVLVPTDFSASANDAADLAASLTAPDGEITLFHATELPIQWAPDLPAFDFDAHVRTLVSEHMQQATASLKTKTNARVEQQTTIGSAGAETIHWLDQHPADLLVMGSHGRTGIKRALLGSVAEKVVRHAHCPVLVARHTTN